MKHAFLSKLLSVFSKIKELTLTKVIPVLSEIGKALYSGFRFVLTWVKRTVPAKYHKWLLLVLVLLLILGLSCCFPKSNTADPIVRIVSADSLEVHKKADADSKVLGQLPYELEVEILEQKTADDTVWGLIDDVSLPDGTTVKGGWIDLQHVKIPGEPEVEPEPTVPVTEPEPEPVYVTATMGTVTAGKLNIRKGAGSQYEAFDSYLKGDRIEIIETVVVDDTVWGRTGIGWVGMGYVRMDGTAAAPSDTEGESASESNIISDGSLGILGYGVIDLGELNVRSGPGTEFDKVGSALERTRYAYYQVEDDWVRIEDGWVSKEYFYMEGTTADDAVFGTVTTDGLNVRTGPHTNFQRVRTYNTGDAVDILGQVGDWGYTAEGWISMSYVELAPPTYTTGTGTVTSGLNIRKEANADSEALDTYKKGDRVLILEVSGEWGKTDKGWINLAYVDFD